MGTGSGSTTGAQWWRDAVIYQVYVRSFADANGDGTGDLAGVRARLPYLRDLGVDAIWFTPWYPSPLADGGYDVADYRAIDPAFGTLRRGRGADRRGARARASARSSTSSRTTSPTSTPGSAARSPRGPARPSASASGSGPGRGPDGELPPNGWQSIFGGAGLDPHHGRRRHARRVVPAPVRARAARPQLDPPRRAARARGRPPLLVRPRRRRRAHRLGGAAGQGPRARRGESRPPAPGEHPYRTATSCTTSTAAGARSPTATPSRASSSARSGCRTRERFARYLRPDELHTAFNFDFLALPVGAGERCARRSTSTLAAHAPVGAPATWVLSNHDVTRPVTRYGREDTLVLLRGQARRALRPTSTLGTRRARAAALLAWRCPARCTSTRARSSACPRSRTCRSTAARTRCTSAPAASTPAATAAACRCRGRATGRRSASARRCVAAAVARQPDDWAALTVEPPRTTTRLDALRSTARACGSGERRAPGRRRRCAWLPARRRRARVHARRATSCASSTSVRMPAALPLGAERPARQQPARRRPPSGRHRGLAPPVGRVQLHSRGATSIQQRSEHDHQAHRRFMRSTREGVTDEVQLRIGTAIAAVGGEPRWPSCSSSSSEARRVGGAAGDATKPITISVASLIPGSTPAATKQFNARSRSSRRRTRTSTSSPCEYQWTGPTFAAKLAAGTLPTVFTVPFTDGRTLGEQRPARGHHRAEVKALPYFDKFNPAVLAEGTDAERQDLRAADRGLRAGAALQPQAVHAGRPRPEQAADDVGRGPARRQADRREDRQGRLRPDGARTTTPPAGSSRRSTTRSAAGWRPVAARSAKATARQPADRRRARTCSRRCAGPTTRWARTSTTAGATSTRRSPPATSACTSAARTSTRTSSRPASIDPSDLRPRRRSRSRRPERRRARRRHARRRRPDAKADAKAAAVKWIDFYYEQKLITKARRVRDAQTLVADKQPVGVPALPHLQQGQYDLANTWIKPYINVPLGQMKPFTTRHLRPDAGPGAGGATQSVYHALDPVVQAVLTDKNAEHRRAARSRRTAPAQSLISSGDVTPRRAARVAGSARPTGAPTAAEVRVTVATCSASSDRAIAGCGGGRGRGRRRRVGRGARRLTWAAAAA